MDVSNLYEEGITPKELADNLIDISTGISNLLENTNIGMFNDIVKNIPLLLDPLNEDRNDDDEDNNDE